MLVLAFIWRALTHSFLEKHRGLLRVYFKGSFRENKPKDNTLQSITIIKERLIQGFEGNSRDFSKQFRGKERGFERIIRTKFWDYKDIIKQILTFCFIYYLINFVNLNCVIEDMSSSFALCV